MARAIIILQPHHCSRLQRIFQKNVDEEVSIHMAVQSIIEEVWPDDLMSDEATLCVETPHMLVVYTLQQ